MAEKMPFNQNFQRFWSDTLYEAVRKGLVLECDPTTLTDAQIGGLLKDPNLNQYFVAITRHMRTFWDKTVTAELQRPISSSSQLMPPTGSVSSAIAISEYAKVAAGIPTERPIDAGRIPAAFKPPEFPATAASATTVATVATSQMSSANMGKSIAAPTSGPAPQRVKMEIDFRLPNGRVGKDYSAAPEILRKAGTPDFNVTAIEIDPDVGLSLTADGKTLAGIPAKAGEFKVKLKLRQVPDMGPNIPDIERTVTLTINPDPKSLWKNLPSDQADPYWKSDEDRQRVQGHERVLIGASKRGRSHAHVGSFRDDDFGLQFDEKSGWHVAAVADGAGSAKCSRKGSLIAIKTAMEFAIEKLGVSLGKSIESDVSHYVKEGQLASSEHVFKIREHILGVLGGAAQECVKAIQREADAMSRPVKEYSTTLIIAIHKKIEGREFVAAYWVGDGGVGVYVDDGLVKVLGDGDSGEFAGQTRFLDAAVMPNEEIIKRLRFTVVEKFSGIVLMTDGITDPKFETDNNLKNPKYWKMMWDELAPGLAPESADGDAFLLKWLDFESAGNHDDRTIAVIV